METTLNAAGLVVFRLDVHLWGGRQALRREQLLAANPALGDLPPSDLASMGSVHICDPEELRRFARIKREAQLVIRDRGLPFLGAEAQPEKYFQATYDRLVELRKEFEAAAADLIARYDQQAQAWCAKWRATHPRYADLLKNIPDAQTVAGRLSFAFDVYRVASPTAIEGHAAGEAFATSVTGLKGELLRDVAAEANELMTKYLVQKDEDTGVTQRREEITQKTLRPLRRAAEKLVTFGFLDPTVQPLADVVQRVLSRMPAEGPINGTDLVEIWSLAGTLGNPSQAAQIGKFASEVGIDDAVKLVSAAKQTTNSASPVDDGQDLAERPLQDQQARAGVEQLFATGAANDAEQAFEQGAGDEQVQAIPLIPMGESLLSIGKPGPQSDAANDAKPVNGQVEGNQAQAAATEETTGDGDGYAADFF